MNFLIPSRIEASSVAKFVDILVRLLVTFVAIWVILARNFSEPPNFPQLRDLLDSSNPGIQDMIPDNLSNLSLLLAYNLSYERLLLLPFISLLIVYLIFNIDKRRIKIIASALYMTFLIVVLVLAPTIIDTVNLPFSCSGFLSICPQSQRDMHVFLLLKLFNKLAEFVPLAVVILLAIFFKFPKKEPFMENGINAPEVKEIGN